ncbi:MAG: hypothetical protein HKL83_03800 [Acidimicrobiaceae bacterium]|nr:hypothetical protein [Acidimicrobiaceae bacterium]
MNPIVRAATKDDSLEIVRLRRLMFEEMALGRSRSGIWEEECVAFFDRTITDGSVVVIVTEDPESKGEGLLSTTAAIIYPRIPAPGIAFAREARLTSIFTVPRFRRAGLAKISMLLMMEVLKSKGVGRADLVATPEGVELYRNLGFREPLNRALQWQVAEGQI